MIKLRTDSRGILQGDVIQQFVEMMMKNLGLDVSILVTCIPASSVETCLACCASAIFIQT